VRRDIWELEKSGPFDPITLAYAKAVKVMQQRPATDPTSWSFQAAIHGSYNNPPPGATWNQCQHQGWFFLPWHRMYLYYFERIVRKAVLAAGGPADFALPYWNYSKPFPANTLPTGFRTGTLPDGTACASPIGQCQGALMIDLNCAALDPIFWLHHANIDRLWNDWLALGGTRVNPPDNSPLLAVVLAVAGAWQLTRAKRRALFACGRTVALPPLGRRADAACTRYAVLQAWRCVKSCWAIMLVMVVVGHSSLVWMVALTALVVAEELTVSGRRLTRPAAGALGLAAVAVALGL